MTYLADCRRGLQLSTETLQLALDELGAGASITVTSKSATALFNGQQSTAPLCEQALIGDFTPVPTSAPDPATPAPAPTTAAQLQADIAALQAALDALQHDTGSK